MLSDRFVPALSCAADTKVGFVAQLLAGAPAIAGLHAYVHELLTPTSVMVPVKLPEVPVAA